MKFWGKGKTNRRNLKIKVGGQIVQTTSNGEGNELKLLDTEVQRIEEVLQCLFKIDKSVNVFDEKGIYISLQCPKFCPFANKEFCTDVVSLIGRELTKKMLLKTSVDTFGFVDYSH